MLFNTPQYCEHNEIVRICGFSCTAFFTFCTYSPISALTSTTIQNRIVHTLVKRAQPIPRALLAHILHGKLIRWSETCIFCFCYHCIFCGMPSLWPVCIQANPAYIINIMHNGYHSEKWIPFLWKSKHWKMNVIFKRNFPAPSFQSLRTKWERLKNSSHHLGLNRCISGMILLYTAQMNNSGMMPCLAPHKSCNNDVKLNKEARCYNYCWGMLNACTSPPGCIVLKLRHCFAAFALFRSPGTIHVIVAELLKSLATSARGGREGDSEWKGKWTICTQYVCSTIYALNMQSRNMQRRSAFISGSWGAQRTGICLD